MIENRIHNVALTDIRVTREVRQRKDLTPESVVGLAEMIAQSQWISPLLVDKETHEIIAGERRFTAVSLLQAAADGSTSLIPAAECRVPGWADWTKIPVQYGKDLTPFDRNVHEWWENAGRKDLPWQDAAEAIANIHYIATEEAQEAGESWAQHQTGKLLGVSQTTVAQCVKCQQALDSGNDKLIEVVKESNTRAAAIQALDRVASRRTDSQPLSLRATAPVTMVAAVTEKKVAAEPAVLSASASVDAEDEAPPPSLGEKLIQVADFPVWAAEYEGPPFNFIHCDFPYGIEFNQSAGQSTAADTKQKGSYDDSEEVYWDLLSTLYLNREALIAPSAHIMFWFSQNLRTETEEELRHYFPGATIQPFLMIWHCSDNSGILPDSNRYGRRTYETAMLLTFGDRRIVAPKALSFAHPRNESSRIHRSQKPRAVLSHFFSMFVDDTSTVLDPTCGSGTSIQVAHEKGASRILGLEIDSDMRAEAVEYFDNSLNKRNVKL